MVSIIPIEHLQIYLILIISFQTVKWLQVLLFNTVTFNTLCTQSNGSKYCYVSLRIQFSINHLFGHTLNVKQFFLSYR